MNGWSRPQKAALLIVISPLVSCLLTMGLLAVLLKASYLFLDFATSVPIILLSTLGCGLGVFLPRYRILAWIPTTVLFVFQFVLMARAKPPAEWIYAVPSYFYTVGTPALALLASRRLAKLIDYRADLQGAKA